MARRLCRFVKKQSVTLLTLQATGRLHHWSTIAVCITPFTAQHNQWTRLVWIPSPATLRQSLPGDRSLSDDVLHLRDTPWSSSADWTIRTQCFPVYSGQPSRHSTTGRYRTLQIDSSWVATWRDHISPALMELHWLLVCYHILFKLALLIHMTHTRKKSREVNQSGFV